MPQKMTKAKMKRSVMDKSLKKYKSDGRKKMMRHKISRKRKGKAIN